MTSLTIRLVELCSIGRQLLASCRLTGFEPVPEGYQKMVEQIIKAYPAPAKKVAVAVDGNKAN